MEKKIKKIKTAQQNQLNTTKYMELENIFQYSVRPEINMAFKTCCIVLDKTLLTNSAYILKVFKKYINPEISHTITVLNYLKDVSAKLASGDIEESHLTLQITKENNIKGDNDNGMLNIILLTYDTDLLTTKSLYRFNESLRGVGGHIYHSLHKNELRNFNLIYIYYYILIFTLAMHLSGLCMIHSVNTGLIHACLTS